jgi:hypothetical protein
MAFRLDILGSLAKKIKGKKSGSASGKSGDEVSAGTEKPGVEASGSGTSENLAAVTGTASPGAVPAQADAAAPDEQPKKKPAPGQRAKLITKEAVEEFGLPDLAPQPKVKRKATYTGERSLVKFRDHDPHAERSPRRSPVPGTARNPDAGGRSRETHLAYDPVFEEEQGVWEEDLPPAHGGSEQDLSPEEGWESPTGSERPGRTQGEDSDDKRAGSRMEQIATETDIGAYRYGESGDREKKPARFIGPVQFGADRFSEIGKRDRIGTIRNGNQLDADRRTATRMGVKTEQFAEEAGLGATVAPDSITESPDHQRSGVRTERFCEESGLGVTVAPDDKTESAFRKRTGTKTERFAEEAGLGATVAPDEDIEADIRKRTGVKTEQFAEYEGLGIRAQPDGPESAEGRVRTGVDSEWFWEETGMGADRIGDDKGKSTITRFIGVEDLKRDKKRHRLVKK